MDKKRGARKNGHYIIKIILITTRALVDLFPLGEGGRGIGSDFV